MTPVRLLPALALFALTVGPAAAQPKGFKALAIGDAAPDFSLPGVDGRTHALKDFADAKVLVVVFTCNHCPTANAYVGRIQKLHDDYKDKGVALVAISPNDPLAVRLDELGLHRRGRLVRGHEDPGQGKGHHLPLPVRRRDAEGLPRLRGAGDPARVRLRPGPEAALQRADRRRRGEGAEVARRPQRHRGGAGGQAGAGREDPGVRLLDQVVRQAGGRQEVAGEVGRGAGRRSARSTTPGWPSWSRTTRRSSW